MGVDLISRARLELRSGGCGYERRCFNGVLARAFRLPSLGKVSLPVFIGAKGVYWIAS